MKNSTCKFASWFWLATTCTLHGQGTFQNLNFESANPIPLVGSPYYPNAVASSNGIPGWVGYIGTDSVDWLFYDTVSLGAAAISLHDSESSYQPIQGNYSVILQPRVAGTPATAAIAQTGEIASTAKALIFYSGSESMQVTFGGLPIPLTQVGIQPAGANRYLILGGDISSFAGQTGEL